jgi:chromosome segregation ATPase
MTPEEEARSRAYAYEMRAQPEGEQMLRIFALVDAVRRDRNAWRAQSDRQVADIAAFIGQLNAARADLAALQQVIDQQAEHLHAARAETEAVRRELGNEIAVLEVRATTAAFDLQQLRSLAAELVEGLREARDDVEAWAGYATDYFKEKHDLAGDLARIDALLSRARALGIGEER